MRKILFLFTVSLFCTNAISAQQARVREYKAPIAGTAALKDADDKYNASVHNLEAPDVEHNYDKKKLREIKAQVAAKYPRQKKSNFQKKATSVPAPTVITGFVADSLSGIPPDNYCAVSNGNKAVAVMNSNITTHDAISGAYVNRKTLYSFSAAVGLNNTATANIHYRFDPKVVYDPQADRFICVMLNSTNQNNWIVLAFSKTNDPNGAWNFYKFYGDFAHDTTWFDYPAISVTKDEFFLTGNKIKYNTSWQEGFKETLIYQFRKSDGYNGDTALNYRIWDNIKFNNKSLRCLHPLNPGSEVSGPEQYFLSNRNFDMSNDSIFLVKVPSAVGTPGTLTITPMISDMPYGVPPNALQPDTSKTLATNDGRVLGGFIRGNEIQFVSTSANAANGNAAIYHGIINNINTTPTVHGRLISNDTLDFGYPNISYTGNSGGENHAIITYEFSGPKTFPGYGAVFYDGADHSGMMVIKPGEKSISMLSGKEQRWGDYSGSQPDWDAIGSVWVEGIFGRKDSRYGNYMARLASPFYVSTAVAAPLQAKEQSKLFPNPGWEYVTYEFQVEKAQAFSFVIYDVAGKVVDKVLNTYCKAGRNMIQFNVAPLATGTYFLQAIGNEGEQIQVHKLIRR